MEETQLKF